MRVRYTGENPHHYLQYYRLQQGGNLPYFRGSVYQRGDGLGSLFAGLTRFVTRLPGWLKTGASMVGKQAARTGMDIARDMASNSDAWKEDWRKVGRQHLKRAAGELLEEGGKRLKQQQEGKGIKGRAKRRKQPQSRTGQRRRRNTTSAKRTTRSTASTARSKRDVFETAPPAF